MLHVIQPYAQHICNSSCGVGLYVIWVCVSSSLGSRAKPKIRILKKKEKKSICQPHAQLRMEQDLLTQAPKSRNEVANRQKSKAKEFILGKIKTTKAQIRHTCPSGDGSDGGGPKWHARRAHFNGQQRLLSVKVGILFSPRPIRTDHRNRDLQYL